MKRPGYEVGSVPVVLRGGPLDSQVMRMPELLPEILVPIQPDFFADIRNVKAKEKPGPEALRINVAVYRRTGTETSLQLPFPAPADARRIGYEYGYVRTDET